MRVVIVTAAYLAFASGLQAIPFVADGTPDSNGSNINVTCGELATRHHALNLARVGYNCPEKPTRDDPTDCDRQLLPDLTSCSSADNQHCFFQLIAEEKACFPNNRTNEEVCNTLHRASNAMLYARQAFCSEISSPDDCGFWTQLGCQLGMAAAEAACAEIGPAGMYACLLGFLGAASGCVPCICQMTGFCPLVV